MQRNLTDTSKQNYILKNGRIIFKRFRIVKHLQTHIWGHEYLIERDSTLYVLKEFFPQCCFYRTPKGEIRIRKNLDDSSLNTFNYLRHIFKTEATHLIKISQTPHPNIIKALKFYPSYEHTMYLLLEYEESQPLDRYIESRFFSQKAPFRTQDLHRLFKGIVSALEHADTLGINHCNLNFDTIRIRTDGSPLLTRFDGSAVFYDDTKKVHLSPFDERFAAPEHIKLKNQKDLDKQTDIYALGVVLYFLLTSSLPPTARERLAKEKDPYTPLFLQKTVLPSIKESFCRTADKALSLEKKRRFDSFEPLLNAFDSKTIIKQVKRHGNLTKTLLGLLLVLAVLFLILS